MTAIAEALSTAPRIARQDPSRPILFCSGRTEIGIRAGTVIDFAVCPLTFEVDTPISIAGDLIAGCDYGIGYAGDGKLYASIADANPLADGWFSGFHFAPGGCAAARDGGDATPAINPHSLWDIDFRPACPDPRGMAVWTIDGKRYWLDVYKLGTDHKAQGTSRIGATIADGDSLERLDYKTAVEIFAGHGKRLPTYAEFVAGAYGVKERSAAGRDPVKTGLDAARTSRIGLMQATGNMWVWGTDGDPEDPRPSLFGGSWLDGGRAGSRYAALGCWPGDSSGLIGARGACDHLNPA